MTDESPRFIISSTVGVYMAINAIRDAYLLVDGPDCAYMRTQYLQGNHDMCSSLTSVSGRHKVSHTNLDPPGVALSREVELVEQLEEIASDPHSGCVLITPMPMAAVLGIDYNRLCREAAARTSTEVVSVPGKSLSDDWLGGYSETLHSLARDLKGLSQADGTERQTPREGAVAVVGLLFDRNEEDCRGNVRELGRLLSAMNLELVSVWPDGGDVADLKDIAASEAIISLPYGRKAAQVLSRRLGVRLIETELPFGLKATERWLREIGRQMGREAEAEIVIEAELHKAVPTLEWLVPCVFEGRRFGYIGDPHLLAGFVETVQLVGGEVTFAVVTNVAHHLERSAEETIETIDAFLIEPRTTTLMSFFEEHLVERAVDCVVSTSAGSDVEPMNRQAVVEFGFPCNNVHALIDRPYLGFRGSLSFFESMANAMRTFRSRSDLFKCQ